MNGSNLAQANPPWLLWGNTQRVQVRPNVGVQANLNTLVRVSYGRPETWHFLLSATLLSAVDGNPAVDVSSAGAEFALYTGIGRSLIKIPTLYTFGWNWGLGQPAVAAPVNLPEWTNQSYQSRPDSSSIFFDFATDVEVYRVETITGTDKFIGQDITIVANVYFNTTVAGADPAEIEISAQVAPAVHVRPDWSRMDVGPAEQFPGGEVGGR